MSTSIEFSERRKRLTTNENDDLKLEETQLKNSSSITTCNALETDCDLQTVESITTLVGTSLSVVSTQQSSIRSARSQYSELDETDQSLVISDDYDTFNRPRRRREQANGQGSTYSLFTWTRKCGISPTIPIRAVFYAIVMFYLLVGLRRLKIRFEDWSYQHANEPELLSLWSYVPQIAVDIILFEIVPLGSLLHIAILDIAFKCPKCTYLIAWFTAFKFTNFFLFTQLVVFVHSMLELINVLIVFFIEIERLWLWFLVFYRFLVLAIYVSILGYTDIMKNTARALTDWAMVRHSRWTGRNRHNA
ncbi:hypothetical protein M3Y96_01227800 [Aphelenchoides besseyi]|nr:hypothetical protein M3Y96_01227800 [Aphelenchoides besseyi]